MDQETEILVRQKISQLTIVNVISEVAERYGIKVFAVGGFVRDIILGRERNDLDILVIGDGTDFAKKIAAELGIANVTYFKNFGTAHFHYNGNEY